MDRIKIGLFSALLFFSCSEENSVDQSAYLFQERNQSETGIDFTNQLTEDETHSIINYIYFYNGGGVSAGDVNNDGLTDLYFVANQGYNKLFINKGNFQFEEVTKTAGVGGSSDWSTGTTMVDINNDGLLDIYVCAVSELLDFKGHNELFINNGDGTFTEKSAEYGLDFKGYSTQSYFFDYDKDGDLDVYIVNHAVHTSLSHGKATQRNKRVPLVGDVLLQNNNGTFTDVSKEANIYGGVNGYGLSATVADFNNDGWEDIYVCNDFHEDDYYYINNQDGTFTEQLDAAFATISRFSMGSDAADINGDGFVDVMTLDMLPNEERYLKETEGDDAMLNMQINLKNLGYKDQYSRNMLQINSGENYFYESALLNKVADTDWSWAPLFADYDNDGHQDLFISNGILRRPNGLDFKKYVSSTFKRYGEAQGLQWLYRSINEMPSGKTSNQIFKGNSQKFQETTGEWIAKKASLANGAIYVDLDLDGDLDLVTNNVNEPAGIFENTLNDSKNFSSIQLRYKDANKEAIGAKVRVFSDGKTQEKHVQKSRGFLSSISSKLHFGLDTIQTIDSIQVIWPNLTSQTIQRPNINEQITIAYSNEATPIEKSIPKEKAVFNPSNLIEYTHEEDNYNDFFVERLIPYKVSMLGPAVAKGDVDGNGYEDLYMGGASGKAARLFLNDGRRFKEKKQPQFEADAEFEDNEALFFDVDQDGDLDLYVASGIHRERKTEFEIDRLYLNNKGNFSAANTTLLKNPLNTGTIAIEDYDADGDLDVFIGNYSNPKHFGATVNSTILINDGKGNFTADANFVINTRVTDAKWIDVNADGQKDLLIAAEWGVPQLFINNNGRLTAQELPDHLEGLWQSISTFDMDGDGDLDIILGNWGTNNRFNKYIDQPIHLYYGDLDKNGNKEALIAYQIDGKYYPINSKDELMSQMNMISKKYVNHADFALKTIEDIFTPEVLQNAKMSQITNLQSGYLENENGKFSRFVPFDDQLQLAPITSFTTLEINGQNQLLVSGNSLRVNTYHGGYKALKGYFVYSKDQITPVSKFGIEPFNTQIKAVTSVQMKGKKALFVVANNNQLKSYTYK